jgi:predicted glycosyltransferase
MNREAAALGVPVYSIFRGNIGAVDRYLATSGRLVLLESVEDVRKRLILARRNRAGVTQATGGALKAIMNHLIEIIESDSCEGETRK